MRIAIFLSLALSALPVAVNSHHSTTLNFSDETITIEGQIKSVLWVNPHCSFILEVTNEAGIVEEWLIEMLARIALERQGFDFEALEVGEVVTVTGRVGYRPNSLYLEEAALQDGMRLTNPGPIR
ncbi:MAG: DUF6152 family protein [Candidatus Rariloculaceae bacterium]